MSSKKRPVSFFRKSTATPSLRRVPDSEALQHNYNRKLAQLHQEGAFEPGVCLQATVAHEKYCAIFSFGYCDCEPDILLTPAPGEVGG